MSLSLTTTPTLQERVESVIERRKDVIRRELQELKDLYQSLTETERNCVKECLTEVSDKIHSQEHVDLQNS